MSQKESQKKNEPLLDEEKDFYLSFVNKKLRNIRKKLDQIDELLKRDQNTLKAEQLEKISSRPEVAQSVKYYEDLKDIYYTAYKAAGEEAKPVQKESSNKKSEANTENIKPNTVPEGEGKKEEVTVALREEIVRDTITKILNFASISQIFGNQSAQENLSKDLNIQSLNDIQNLHKSVFDFVEGTDSRKLEDRVNQSIDRLTRYVNAEDQASKSIQENVERIVNLPAFKNYTSVSKEPEVQPKTEVVAVQEVQEESLAPLTTTAALLKPDIDDFVHSPEKGRYLPKEPKVVRFVDEIERDMQSNQTQQRDSSTPLSGEGEIQVAKESREPAEAPEEVTEETQEQKSFRKKRPNNGSNYNKPRNNEYNNSNGNQSNKGFSGQRRYGNNDGSRGYYQGRGNGSKYEYREYVQKRPSGDQ